MKRSLHRAIVAEIQSDVARKDLTTAAIAILGWTCYVVAALLLSWVTGAVIHNDLLTREAASNITNAAQEWPPQDRRQALDEARKYNENLPSKLSGNIPADARNAAGTPLENTDSAYMRALDVDGRGAMASLKIPSISVNIPVYHTTLGKVLDSGAGHIYGTSLPIGDPGTYSALSAHSGGVQGLLFTRLHELRPGGHFYLDVLSGEQAYTVVNVRVVNPRKLERTLQQLRAEYTPRHQAVVTLITCTPIGINSDRLLVTGIRDDTAPEAATQRDPLVWSALLALLLFVVLMAIAILSRRSHGIMHGQHMASPDGDATAKQ